MARRQKAPTPEELVEKLEERFNVWKEEQSELLEQMKQEHKEALRELKTEHEQEKIKWQELREMDRTENRERLQLMKGEQDQLCQNLQEEIMSHFNVLKENVDNYNAKMEEGIKTNNDNVNDQIGESKANINLLEEKISTSISDIIKRVNEETTEIVANSDIFRDEVEQKFTEVRQNSEDRIKEITSQTKTSNARREEYFSEFKEELEGLNVKIEEVLDSVGITIQDKLKETYSDFQARMAADAQESQSHRAEIDFDLAGLKEKLESLDQGLNEVNEKIYEFEQNKRNNLIFYGLSNELRETPEVLLSKIQTIIRVTLGVRRDISISKVSRMYTGPEITGTRPILVTFESFKDREEVLRKANLLKGSNIHISEDLSKRVRETRGELRKFMRIMKRSDPTAQCFIQYDKLYVNNKIYVFNDLQGKVVEQNQVEDPLAMSLAAMVMSRPGSVMDCDRPGSSLSNFGALMSPTKTPVRSRSTRGKLRNSLSLGAADFTNIQNSARPQSPEESTGDRIRELESLLNDQQSNFSDKMRDMEDVIKRQEDLLSKLQTN